MSQTVATLSQAEVDAYLFRAAREGGADVPDAFITSQYDLNRQDAKGLRP